MIAKIVAGPYSSIPAWPRNAPLKLYGPKFRSMILTPEPLRPSSWTLREPEILRSPEKVPLENDALSLQPPRV
jgi:hypothetical protein